MIKQLWANSIEKRLLMMFIIFAIVLSIVVAAFRAWEVTSEFTRLELMQAEKYAKISIGYLEHELSDIDGIVIDSAILNEISYTIEHDKVLNLSILTPKLLSQAKLDGLLVLGNDFQVVDGISGLALELETSLWAKIEKLETELIQKGNVKGLLVIDEKAFFFSMNEIHSLYSQAKSVGHYFVFKKLDSELFSALSDAMSENVELLYDYRMQNKQPLYLLDNRLHFALDSIKRDNELVNASFYLYDSKGTPIELSLQLEFKAFKSHFYGPLFTLVPSLVLTTLVSIFLLLVIRCFITQPLLALSDNLHQLKGADGKFIPMNIQRDDEFGRLVGDINKLFSRLYKKEQFNKLLLSSIDNLVFVLDNRGQVTFATQASADWLGVEINEIINFDLDFLLTNVGTDSPEVSVWVHQILNEQNSISYNCQLRSMTRPDYIDEAQVRGYPIDSEDAELSGGIVIIRFNEKHEFIDILDE